MAESPVPKATKVVRTAGLGPWLAALTAGETVMAPVMVDGKSLFRELAPGQEGSLDLLSVHTVNSTKGGVLPQTEAMLGYQIGKDEQGAPSITVQPKGTPRSLILFGLRPCDAAAIELLDKVFLTGDFVDDAYKERREATTVVTVACPAPAKSCFCTSFGLTPGDSRGADVVLYGKSGPGKLEADGYYAVAYTDRGESLLNGASSKAAGLTELEPKAAQGFENVVAAFRALATPLGEKLGRVDVAGKLDGLFEHPYWEKIAGRCISCGTCTFVCPTCYCFGVADSGVAEGGVRFRYWDSCKFPQFLQMAGGHNPRPAKKMRTRQRFMHKLNYYHHRYGEYLCVGCGRCVDSCPVGLHLPLVAGDVRGL